MKKRVLSLTLAVLMLFSMFTSISLSVSAATQTAPPDGTLFVNLGWTESTTPASITVGGKSFPLTWGTNAFSAPQTALDAAAAGGTVYLAAGTYSTQFYLKKNVTLLGAKYGIDPNIKSSDPKTAWSLSSERGTGETVISTSVHLGVNGNSVFAAATDLTIDGIQMTGGGMFRSNTGTTGGAKITVKNVYVKNCTGGNPNFYFKPYYGSPAGSNLYKRDITLENIHVSGQTAGDLIGGLVADKFTATGIYMDATCTKGFISGAGASSDSTDAIEWTIAESMFCNPMYRVIYLDWATDTSNYNANGSVSIKPAENLANRTSVTTTVKDCVFLNSHNSTQQYTLAFRQNTANTYYVFTGNTFITTGTVAANYAPLAGYTSVTSIKYGSKITVKNNRFIGSQPLCWSYSGAGESVDISGNYCENASGVVSALTASGPTIQDWYWLDYEMTDRSDGGAGIVPAEQIVNIDTQVKWLGRTYDADGRRYFNWTNSGFEFNINGTGASALISSNNPGGTGTGYLKVYVDGVHTQTIEMNWPNKTVTLASGLSDGPHTIRVIKRTNGRSSTAGLRQLWVDEGTEILTPNAPAGRKMQFVGDSITVGYGSLNPNNETTWSTSTEDGSITYAALAGQYFGADYHTIAVSGRGIVKNNGGDTNDYAPAMYEYTDWSNKANWTHSKYQSDVIVINYGTNDKSAGVSNADFKVGAKAFVQQVRADNPNAEIIYAYGFMGDSYKTEVEAMVNELRAAGDSKVHYLYLTPITNSEKSLGHPNAAAHADRAEDLIAKVSEITGWTEHSTCSYSSNVITEPDNENTGVTRYTCAVCGDTYDVTTPYLKVSGTTLTLYSDISINYYVDKALFNGTGYTDPYMEFAFGGTKTVVKDYTEKDGYLVFSYKNIAPDRMGDDVTSTLYASVGETLYSSATAEYCVADYCYAQLTNSNDAVLHRLLVDLLNYGAETQTYTGYKADNLVNASLTPDQQLLASADIESFTDSLNTKVATVGNPSVKWKGAELRLDSAITMKFLIETASTENLKVVITDDNSHSWTVEAEDFVEKAEGQYYVLFSGLDAAMMSEKVYLTVYNGDEAVSNTVCYSIESYAYAKKDSTYKNLAALVNDMMKYGNSAAYYKAQKGV